MQHDFFPENVSIQHHLMRMIVVNFTTLKLCLHHDKHVTFMLY